jgi:hypothetical protein
VLFTASINATNNLILECEKTSENLFSEYINTFTKNPLPLSLDRNKVIEFSKYRRTNYCEIDIDFEIFIPKKIKEKYPNQCCSFRSIFLLPEWNGKIVSLICLDFNYDCMETYLIIYEKSGVIVDYQELASFSYVFEESRVEIQKDYTIQRTCYVLSNDVEGKDFMTETVYWLKLNKDGLIEKKEELTKSGYYKYEDNHYILQEKNE